jgi:hypothetical protein
MDFMTQEYGKTERLRGALTLLGGLFLTAIPFLVAFLMQSLGAPVILLLKGVGVFGAFVAIAGLYETITGSRKINEARLVQRWLAHNSTSPLREPALSPSA